MESGIKRKNNYYNAQVKPLLKSGADRFLPISCMFVFHCRLKKKMYKN